MPTIKDALDIIGKLTVAEQESLKTMLLSTAFVKSLNIEDFVAKERFANGRVCPLCGCIHVVRNGHRKDGTQRYVCKDCGKSFVIATNSIVSGTRKDLSVWEQYIDCMMNGLSIRKTAVACGIHRNTAFLWRHKILDALQNMADDVTLNGIIEADETFFAISYKGNHSKSKTFTMPRKAHKRGHSTHIRGLSKEKVCVPCAVNRNGLSISKITNTGRVSTKDLHHIYDGRIKTNSTLVTDKMNSYVRFTNANGIDLVQLKTGKAKKGIYNIQHINSYHSNAGTIKIHTFDCDVSLDLFKRFCKFFISVLEFKDYCFILNYNLFDPHIMQTIWNGRIVFIFCPHETSPSNSNLSISFYLLIIPYNSIRNTKILQTIPPQNRYNFKPSYLKKLFLLSSSSRIFCFITLVSVSDCFSRSFVALCIASIFACNAFLTSWTVFSLTSSFRLPISPDIAS